MFDSSPLDTQSLLTYTVAAFALALAPGPGAWTNLVPKSGTDTFARYK
jgi:hypothetical protein